GGSRSRADAIFASVRGIDPKLRIIKAAATGRDGEPWDRLIQILDTVKDVSGVRNQIAHAAPVQKSSLRTRVRTKNGRILEAVGVDQIESRLELHKAAHRGEHEGNRKTIARGKPGCLGCTCQIRVHSFATLAHGAAGAVSARLSLRPLLARGTAKS